MAIGETVFNHMSLKHGLSMFNQPGLGKAIAKLRGINFTQFGLAYRKAGIAARCVIVIDNIVA
ncbi:hypothetical protein D3C86_1816740 [compost metagenome]